MGHFYNIQLLAMLQDSFQRDNSLATALVVIVVIAFIFLLAWSRKKNKH